MLYGSDKIRFFKAPLPKKEDQLFKKLLNLAVVLVIYIYNTNLKEISTEMNVFYRIKTRHYEMVGKNMIALNYMMCGV